MNFFAKTDTATTRVRKIIDDLGRIATATATCDRELEGVHALRVAALAGRSAAEAASALGEEADLAGARRAIHDTEAMIENLQIRRDALADRAAFREDELLGLQDQLHAELDEVRRKHVTAWQAEFYRTAAQLRALLLRGLALADVSRADFGPYLVDAKLFDPENITLNLLDTDVRQYQESAGCSVPLGWRGDAAALKFGESIEPTFQVFAAAHKLITSLERVRHAAAIESSNREAARQ